MSIKKSIVTRVTGNGTWEGNYGLMYKFEIEMENGDIGENLSKSFLLILIFFNEIVFDILMILQQKVFYLYFV